MSSSPMIISRHSISMATHRKISNGYSGSRKTSSMCDPAPEKNMKRQKKSIKWRKNNTQNVFGKKESNQKYFPHLVNLCCQSYPKFLCQLKCGTIYFANKLRSSIINESLVVLTVFNKLFGSFLGPFDDSW